MTFGFLGTQKERAPGQGEEQVLYRYRAQRQGEFLDLFAFRPDIEPYPAALLPSSNGADKAADAGIHRHTDAL